MNTPHNTLLVESVIPLTKDQLEQIKALTRDKTISQVENRVMPDLIGGMRLSLRGKVIDLSLKSRIINLRAKLA